MAVTIHLGTSFLVSDDLGDVDPEADRGYFHLDTRFLSLHALRLDGKPPILLQPHLPSDGEAVHFLTNPELDGAPRARLGIVVRRALGGGLREAIELESYAGGSARLELSLSFDADFAYVLTVKQRASGGGDGAGRWRGRVRRDVSGGREVVLRLDEGGAPHRTAIAFDPPPDRLAPGEAAWRVSLPPRGRWSCAVEVSPSIGAGWVRPAPPPPPSIEVARKRHRALGREMPRVESDHPVLARALDRASRDAASLAIKAQGTGGEDDTGGGGRYAIAAGIPWYMDLFGRDSLVASYEAMLHAPSLARGTLEALARLQGEKVDPVSEEAPGKILHEYRRGPLTPAARKLIPAYPYYGTIDATPLFLVTLSEYVRATGDLDLARRLWDHVEAAVGWMRADGDRDGDGLLEYERSSDAGLVNQGWKDSTDSVRFRDGRIAAPPIALVEVQGYAYDARRRTADLARRLGRGEEAARLDAEASALRRRIRERYWLPDRRYYAEALDGAKRPVDAVTSNPGHLLWSGAVEPDHARAIAAVLLGDELFSGFGVRTMGAREGGYDPVSYHDGSVWPHDTALALAGLVRYGLRDEATRLAAGLLAALDGLPDVEAPELFCGWSAREFPVPVRYPTACRPQAWAACAVMLLARSVLGLDVNALDGEVSVAPLAIPGMTRLALRGVPAGAARIDVAVRVDGGRAVADVARLPRGWRRVEPEVPGA